MLIRVEVVRVHSISVNVAEGSLQVPHAAPIVPGQDFCGTIVGLGSSVDKADLKLGRRVAVEPRSFCAQ